MANISAERKSEPGADFIASITAAPARPYAGFYRRRWFGPRCRRFQLRQDRLQRVEPGSERVRVVFERVAEVGDERRSLVIGLIEHHDTVI